MTAEENRAIVATKDESNIPMMTPEEAKAWWDGFLRLKRMLLTETDYMKDKQGKSYIRKSGFRKLMYAFGLTDKIVSEERTERENGTFYWRVTVEVSAPNGRTATGAAICDSKEKENKSLPGQLEHNTYTMAHTRAKNRAVSDLVAGGEVSAEEMEAVETPVEQPAPATTRPKISPKSTLSVSTLEETDVRGKAGGFK